MAKEPKTVSQEIEDAANRILDYMDSWEIKGADVLRTLEQAINQHKTEVKEQDSEARKRVTADRAAAKKAAKKAAKPIEKRSKSNVMGERTISVVIRIIDEQNERVPMSYIMETASTELYGRNIRTEPLTQAEMFNFFDRDPIGIARAEKVIIPFH